MNDEVAGEVAGFRTGVGVGSRIAGYRLEGQIGRGGMAEVFLARDERLGRMVALKVLAPALGMDQGFRQRFIRESRAAAAVDDPQMAAELETGSGSGWPASARIHLPRRREMSSSVSPADMVNVRYMVDDVQAAIEFYTRHLGFTLRFSATPAFADLTRGSLRLLLAGPKSSAGRPMPDGRIPAPGGWNRIHFIVPDIAAEVDRLRAEGVPFRNDIITGPGGKQVLVEDPAGNVVELFEPAVSSAPAR